MSIVVFVLADGGRRSLSITNTEFSDALKEIGLFEHQLKL